MGKEFHSGDRISLADAARILKVRVQDLREAAKNQREISGFMPPKPFNDSYGRANFFWMGEFIEALEARGKQYPRPHGPEPSLPHGAGR